MEKKPAFNPYLPSWEYIPDGEPYIFGDRIYIYGSHDYYNGYVFCMGDYVCWSAPIDDLGNWRYEGVIYERCADPMNREGKMCLYAPDVTVGPDGRYYLYYVLDKTPVISVAVCDTPAGRYEFYGYVRYTDGTRLGEAEGDEPQFDPGVITEGETTYLYSGFCGKGDKSRTGSRAVVLDRDMITVKTVPVTVIPGCEYSKGTGFEGHAFFEASSIRKFDDKYYLIYSSEVMHELCYAVSDNPLGGFEYGGVLISNSDIGIDSYKPAGLPMAYGANNHGSVIKIGESYCVFYHRHTNGTWYSRQGCAERITMKSDGSFLQAEMTSCGLNGKPLPGRGEYPAYLACNLFTEKHSLYVGEENSPKIMQDGKDGDEETGYIGNITKGAVMGFKYFDCKGVKRVSITTRGYAKGEYQISTSWEGKPLGEITVDFSNVWEKYSAEISVPDGVTGIYLKFTGEGNSMLKSFELE